MKFWRYLRYLARHKWATFVYANELGIPTLGILHDSSKVLPDEWGPYADHFYGKEKTASAFDAAWLRHVHRNRHHWQYWVMVRGDGRVRALPMPDRYRREMLADWMGASKAQGNGDDVAGWYLQNRHKMILHIDTRKWIEEQLGLWKKQP